jgi:very-short-patch-repair endonuclease
VRLAAAPFVVPPLPEEGVREHGGVGHPPPPSMGLPGHPLGTDAGALSSEDVRTDPRHRAGDPFHSARAPRTASAAEAELRARLAERFDLDLSPERANAIAVTRPFFGRTEVWPDIVIPELRVAIEYDTVGRFGLEHVGPREDTDRRKDRMLRAVGWEVIRVRCGKLQPIGPHDIVASGVTNRVVDALVDGLRTIRGDLFVNAYLR